MNLVSFILATGVSSVVLLKRELRVLQFRFEFVTDSGSNSLGFIHVVCFPKAFKADSEKPLEQELPIDPLQWDVALLLIN